MSVSLFGPIEFLALRPYDAGLAAPVICTNQLEYWRDDPIGHVVATFPVSPNAWDLRIEVLPDADHGPLETMLVTPPNQADRKVAIILRVGALAFGTYAVRLTLVDHALGQDAAQVSARFTKVDQAKELISIPADGIPIEVEAQSHIPDGLWPVETGVPLPQGAVLDPGELALFEDGKPVPAGLTVRSLWHPNGSIKWLGLAFTPQWSTGVPRSYRLRRAPGAPPGGRIKVRESSRAVTVNTGDFTFMVSKAAFAGIEEYSSTSPGQSPTNRGGPYVVDAQGASYESWRARPDAFHVERGPTQVRITVSGWYASARGQRLCRYHTQIKAFAGLAQVHIAHHTIITFDPAQTQLADVGWSIPVSDSTEFRTAVDGQVLQGSVSADSSTGIHQDRADRCWLIEDEPAGPDRQLEGKRADGWFSADNGSTGVTVVLREIAEKFPKEIELVRRDKEGWLLLHFWPRHGQENTFTTKSTPPDLSSDALDRHNIHKLWYAHEGQYLDLTFPRSYADELVALAHGPLVSGENPVGGDDEIQNALTGAAIGVAIGNDFAIFSHRASLSDEERAAFAGMFQDDPGALPEPAWSAACGVEGRWAARDPMLFPQAERMLDLSLPGFQRAVVDIPRQYGMWIYGGVHNKWLPVLDAPELHRVWQASHYRNVWMAWFLYLRSGLSALRRWARATSDRYLDIGTVHHVDPAVRGGKNVGDLYHCYGFTPWGGQSDVWGHWVDPDAHRLRFLLTGDQFANEAYDNWWHALRDLSGLSFGGGRENAQTLGVLTDCYCHTLDPCALELMWRFADGFFAYHYNPNTGHYGPASFSAPSVVNPVWHRQWLMLYHGLTRDPRAVDFVLDLIGAGLGDLSPNAFAAHATGNADWVRRLVPDFLDQCLQVEDDAADRYHGYGPGTSTNVGTYLLQQAPYFLRALRDAGMSVLVPGNQQVAYPAVRWSATYSGHWAVRVYAVIRGGSTGFPVNLQPLLGFDHVSGIGNVIVSRWDAMAAQWVIVVQDNFSPEQVKSLNVPNTPTDWLCRIDLECPDARFFAPITPFPEVAVLRKMHFNGAIWVYASYGVARQDWWLASLDTQPADLTIEGVQGVYDLPDFVAIEDPRTHVLSGRTVFAYAQDDAGVPLPNRRAVTVQRQPPGPWHLYTASNNGAVFKLMNGPDRLFLARTRSDLESVLPSLTGVDLS